MIQLRLSQLILDNHLVSETCQMQFESIGSESKCITTYDIFLKIEVPALVYDVSSLAITCLLVVKEVSINQTNRITRLLRHQHPTSKGRRSPSNGLGRRRVWKMRSVARVRSTFSEFAAQVEPLSPSRMASSSSSAWHSPVVKCPSSNRPNGSNGSLPTALEGPTQCCLANDGAWTQHSLVGSVSTQNGRTQAQSLKHLKKAGWSLSQWKHLKTALHSPSSWSVKHNLCKWKGDAL